MKRPLLITLAIFILVFIIVTFLNCGREANAIPEREQVKRNKIDYKYLVESSEQLASQDTPQGAIECKRIDASYVHENYLANRLFTETLIGRWCYDGERVVSHRWNKDKHIGNYWWSNWRFEGWDDPNDTGGNSMRYVFRRIKATFAVNILWFERNVTPYVQCTLRGDGTFECGKGD